MRLRKLDGGGCASQSCPRYIRFRRLFSSLPAKAPSAIISRTASLCTYWWACVNARFPDVLKPVLVGVLMGSMAEVRILALLGFLLWYDGYMMKYWEGLNETN